MAKLPIKVRRYGSLINIHPSVNYLMYVLFSFRNCSHFWNQRAKQY